jgi:hypothetical protein
LVENGVYACELNPENGAFAPNYIFVEPSICCLPARGKVYCEGGVLK